MGQARKKENFEIIAEVKGLDSKNRAVFPKEIASILKSGFDLAQNQKGELKIIPMVRVPANEAWLFENPKVLKKIDKGMKQSKENKVRKLSLDDI